MFIGHVGGVFFGEFLAIAFVHFSTGNVIFLSIDLHMIFIH